ncbi:Ribosomal RNA small subunit methyltransferase B [bioreactor metagenome]|uniref:Ribosomal RNA small subunit methyltransferase B n=1 Tax=bioreactor metagenome TaxID=1076179 RepID=A0A645AE38_9ZZZZ
MRIINLIDVCGQLLNIIQKNNQTDKITEQFFRSKRKLLGSKERKFISQIVFATVRNLTLIKNIAEKNNFYELLKHPDIFKNEPRNSICIMIQIILAEKFPQDFDYIDVSFVNYKTISNNSTSDNSEIYLNFIESVKSDLTIITNSYEFSTILTNIFSENIINYYLTINNHIKSIKKHTNLYGEFDSNNDAGFNTETIPNAIQIIAERYSFHIDFINLLIKHSEKINVGNFINLAESLNVPAPICIRVNQTISTTDKVINYLNANNIEAQKGKISNSCIVINKRYQLIELDAYKKGAFVIQDEASQLVALCANPKPQDIILDACAGAGGKSLHLADLQQDKSTIIASDVEFLKIKEIPKRSALSGFKSIQIAKSDKNGNIFLLKDSKQVKNKFDIVLIDAPCSGTGTIRRDPTKKFNVTPKTINKISEIQYQILMNYSKYVKNNGHLLYSTCSIFPQENELIVKRFLNENPDFSPEPIKKHLLEHNVILENLNDDDFYITLYPFIHKTDGFFIAKLKRNN